MRFRILVLLLFLVLSAASPPKALADGCDSQVNSQVYMDSAGQLWEEDCTEWNCQWSQKNPDGTITVTFSSGFECWTYPIGE